MKDLNSHPCMYVPLSGPGKNFTFDPATGDIRATPKPFGGFHGGIVAGMEAKHTPGPWKVVIMTVGRRTYALEVHDSADKAVAVLGDVNGTVLVDDEVETSLPDARLIAAAPDLLAACEAVIKGSGAKSGPGSLGGWCDAKTLDQLRQAIAKALGQ